MNDLMCTAEGLPSSAEKAVPEVKMVDLTQIGVAISADRPIDLIADGERAIADPFKYEDAEKKGFFSPTINMAQITGVFDDRLFAAVSIEADGTRKVEFCQQYVDRTYSPVIDIKQAELIVAVRYGGELTKMDSPFVAQQKRKALKIWSALSDEYYGKVVCDEPYPLDQLLTVLMYAITRLPVRQADHGELSRESFYGLLREEIHEYFRCNICRDLYEKHSYFALTDEQMEAISIRMGMTKAKLLKKLHEFNFLYLTESCRGYQAKVYFDKDTRDWAYCILKLETLAGDFEVSRKNS